MPPAAGSTASAAASAPAATDPESNSTDDLGLVPPVAVDSRAGSNSASDAVFKRSTPAPTSSAAVDLLMTLELPDTAADTADEGHVGSSENDSPESTTAFEIAWDEIDAASEWLVRVEFDVP
jgi:hypothetical protein